MTGISRKLPDTERTRLKGILKRIVPDDAGVIVRTAAEGASEEELAARRRPAGRAVGEHLRRRPRPRSAPAHALRRARPDRPGGPRHLQRGLQQARRQSATRRGTTVEEYVAARRPRPGAAAVASGPTPDDVFAAHRIDEQLAKALDRKVWLPSGGYLIIDRTEAMTVVDVNTGKFTGSGRQPRADGHQEQHRGGRRDRPSAAAARRRRHHRRRLHRHGAREQPRARAASTASSAWAATAPSTRWPRSPRSAWSR